MGEESYGPMRVAGRVFQFNKSRWRLRRKQPLEPTPKDGDGKSGQQEIESNAVVASLVGLDARPSTATLSANSCQGQGNVIGATGPSEGRRRLQPRWRQPTSSSKLEGVSKSVIILIALLWVLLASCATLQGNALHITTFRVPAYVPITLPTASGAGQQQTGTDQGADSKSSDNQQLQQPAALARQKERHPLDLAKPILLDCDYYYQPEEDARLTVRWFRNKEPEPFYQWLPELNVRHFADWIKPLINQTFVSDPREPLKRYRSLLIKRLSMNLTGQYTCLVSSLAGQDMRQASLVVYQPPRSFTFEHRVFPAPALVAPPLAPPPFLPHAPPTGHAAAAIGPHNYYTPTQRHRLAQLPMDQTSPTSGGVSSTGVAGASAAAAAASPTQFRLFGQGAAVIRPPNNSNYNQSGSSISSLAAGGGSQITSSQQHQANSSSTRIVYTHDGRPIRRKSRSHAPHSISSWQLQNRHLSPAAGAPTAADSASPVTSLPAPLSMMMMASSAADDSRQMTMLATSGQQQQQVGQEMPKFAIQLHHFQCQATQVTPRPVIVLTVKRQADSIAQYLHEASSVSIRPYQVRHADYFEQQPSSSLAAPNEEHRQQQHQQPPALLVTLYDITVSATVALNVSLQQQPAQIASLDLGARGPVAAASSASGQAAAATVQQQQAPGVSTVLSFRRSQRMSFECHLEITGTDFEQRKRININEEEVYQFAEAEEQRKRLRAQQDSRGQLKDIPGSNELDQTASGRFGASLGFSSSSTAATMTTTTTNLLLAPAITVALLVQRWR